MKIIENQTFDEERALYGERDILVKDCSFDGPADGESAFKNARTCRWSVVSLICVIRSGMITG